MRQLPGRRLLLANQRAQQHRAAKHQQHEAPDQIDVDAQGAFIEILGTIRHQAEARKQDAIEAEDDANGEPQVKVHGALGWVYQKMMLSRSVAPSTSTPTVTGCMYQGSCSVFGFSVSEYTRPFNCSSVLS